MNLEELVMRTHTSFSILTAGLLALACAGGTAQKEAATGTTDLPAGSEPAPTAFPGAEGPAPEPTASDAPASARDQGGAAEADATPPPPARAPAAAAPSSTEGAPRARAEAKKSSRPLDLETERPGLGTTW